MNRFAISHLRASVDGKEILHDISLIIRSGEVHAVMGPNGSGKSTLASALLGHPAYTVHGKAMLNGKNILRLPTEKRGQSGLFLAFQSPVAISGVSVVNLLREAYRVRFGKIAKKKQSVQNPAFFGGGHVGQMPVAAFTEKIRSVARSLGLNEDLLRRGIHDGFSGGEKKKIEMLEALMLSPSFAVFDEIDTGLDVDALRFVSRGITELTKAGAGVIIITHYQRILKYVKPDYVHVLVSGNIVKSGSARLAKTIETYGYSSYTV